MSCNARVIIEYSRRRSGLPSAPLDMKYDKNRDHRGIVIALNINIGISTNPLTRQDKTRQSHTRFSRPVSPVLSTHQHTPSGNGWYCRCHQYLVLLFLLVQDRDWRTLVCSFLCYLWISLCLCLCLFLYLLARHPNPQQSMR